MSKNVLEWVNFLLRCYVFCERRNRKRNKQNETRATSEHQRYWSIPRYNLCPLYIYRLVTDEWEDRVADYCILTCIGFLNISFGWYVANVMHLYMTWFLLEYEYEDTLYNTVILNWKWCLRSMTLPCKYDEDACTCMVRIFISRVIWLVQLNRVNVNAWVINAHCTIKGIFLKKVLYLDPCVNIIHPSGSAAVHQSGKTS